MSNRHIQATWDLEVTSRNLLVALALADRACEACGAAWPGREDLARRTKLGHTSIEAALDELEHGTRDARGVVTHAGGHLVTLQNARGGRGRKTLYIVLPRLEGLLAAPCRACQDRMVGVAPRARAPEKGPAAQDLSDSGAPANAPARREVSGARKGPGWRDLAGKPPAPAPLKLPLGGGADSAQLAASASRSAISAARQPSVNQETSARVPARESRAEPAPPAVSGSPPASPTVGGVLREMFPGIALNGHLDSIAFAPASTPTARSGATAQPGCQPARPARTVAGHRHGPTSVGATLERDFQGVTAAARGPNGAAPALRDPASPAGRLAADGRAGPERGP